MEYGLEATDIQQIRAVFARHPRVKEVILFGSRAMGNYKEGSDIDLAIAGTGLTLDDIMELNDGLERLGMLYKFDLQNMAVIKDPDVINHIKRVGKIFYP